MKKCTKIGLLAITVSVVLVAVFMWWFSKETHGICSGSVWWLPPEARDVTYLRNYAISMAEFDIGQEAFEKWCSDRKMPLRQLGDAEHRSIRRCLMLLEQRGIIPAIRESIEVAGHLSTASRRTKDLGPGDLFYEERWDNGGGYTIGYDVSGKRGYYEFLHH